MSLADSPYARATAGVAAMVGVGHTDYRPHYDAVRAGQKPFDSYGYAAVALQRALDDAGIERSEVDGLITGPQISFERSSELFGIAPRWGGQADAVQGVVTAVMAIRSGLAEVVALVYGNDQRSAKVQYGGPQAMGGGANLSYVFHAPMGLTSQGALYALMWRRHMELTGATEADLGEVSVGQRAWARHNPHAIMRDPLTIEDYLNGRYIAEPLHLNDYCLINDGGVAFIIMEASRAKRMAKKPPVYIKAAARADLHDQSSTLRPRLIDFYHSGHDIVAKEVYETVGFGPKDVDALMVYDSFSCHIPFVLEGFGFCGIGEAGPFMRETGIGPGGGLPVNTSGGHLSESYMQGWNHQVEAVRQLRGEAGLNVENCRNVQFVSDFVGKVFSIMYGVDP